MAADISSPPTAKLPRSGWRYSLRTLLVCFTLLCVGVWYWFRVPYRQELSHERARIFAEPHPEFPITVQREVRHYRRTLFGEPVREGRSEYFDHNGFLVGREEWREGRLHGEYLRWYPGDRIRQRGQCQAGERVGEWETFDLAGQVFRRTCFDDRGRPHGDDQLLKDGKPIHTVRYVHGQAAWINGEEIETP